MIEHGYWYKLAGLCRVHTFNSNTYEAMANAMRDTGRAWAHDQTEYGRARGLVVLSDPRTSTVVTLAASPYPTLARIVRTSYRCMLQHASAVTCNKHQISARLATIMAATVETFLFWISVIRCGSS